MYSIVNGNKFGRRDKGKQKKENEWIYDTLIVQQMMYL